MNRPSRRLTLPGAAALAALAAGLPARAADTPDIVVSYWGQASPLPETILATQPALLQTLPAHVSFRQINSGPAAGWPG